MGKTENRGAESFYGPWCWGIEDLGRFSNSKIALRVCWALRKEQPCCFLFSPEVHFGRDDCASPEDFWTCSLLGGCPQAWNEVSPGQQACVLHMCMCSSLRYHTLFGPLDRNWELDGEGAGTWCRLGSGSSLNPQQVILLAFSSTPTPQNLGHAYNHWLLKMWNHERSFPGLECGSHALAHSYLSLGSPQGDLPLRLPDKI